MNQAIQIYIEIIRNTEIKSMNIFGQKSKFISRQGNIFIFIDQLVMLYYSNNAKSII